mgnify:CR=1 FL=1
MTCGVSLGQKLGIKDSMQEENRRRKTMHDVFLFIAGMLMPVVLSVVLMGLGAIIVLLVGWAIICISKEDM